MRIPSRKLMQLYLNWHPVTISLRWRIFQSVLIIFCTIRIANCCKLTTMIFYLYIWYFKQGLAHLSSTTLIGASDLIVKHLIHTLPLRESNLRATIAATIEMDFGELHGLDKNCLLVYLERLMRNASTKSKLSRPNSLLDDLTFFISRCYSNWKTWELDGWRF